MKHFTFRSPILATALLVALAGQAQIHNVAVNATGAGAAPTALLDISSTTQGFLIPRMTAAERSLVAVGAAQDGLTVYQTDGAHGFYYYDGSALAWVYMIGGAQPWQLLGNTGTGAGVNFLGTTDPQPLIFRTGPAVAVERMRLTATGNLGIGQPAPVEKLDIAGAIKLTGTSATDNAGTIRWSAVNSHHEGNIDGTPTGWKKLENDYMEVFGATYSQPSPFTCAAGAAYIGPWTTYWSPGPPAPTSNTPQVGPYAHGNNAAVGFIRVRHQYLFRANELDLEQNQLFGGAWGASATSGLCPGQPINSVSFYVTNNPGDKAYLFNVNIKHSAQSSLIGFDNTVDPAGQCYASGGVPVNQPGGTGWITYTFPTPFIWNGVNSIIVEYVLAEPNTYVVNPTVWASTPLTFNGTFYAFGSIAGGLGTAGSPGCVSGVFNSATCPFSPTASCSGNALNSSGPSTTRPIIQFNGVTSSALPAVVGTGKYIFYNGDPSTAGLPAPGTGGGFLVQTTPPGTWAAQIAPYYGFKGPGTVGAENGVYDDQVRLNDHVFDRYFDGRVKPEDAAAFGDQRTCSMDEMVNYVERQRHLPTMKGRDAWRRQGGFSLGDLGNQLWATTETQALYLTELNDRLDVLRLLSTNESLSPRDLEAMRSAICSMGELSESEKDGLIRSCLARSSNSNEQAR